MSQHSFPNLQSSSQATLICYRGPGCATQYLFDSLGADYPVVSTLAEAQTLASKDFRDQCSGFFIDDLSETPFGDLTLPSANYTGGFAEICSGLVPDGTYSTCKLEDQIALIHLTGPEGSLRVDMAVWQLITVEPFCVNSVQVVNGSCTWYGTHVECAGTSATLGLVWDSEQRCCGKLGQDLAQSECTGTANALNTDTCQNEGPPVGFETDPSCITFDQFNSNAERKPIQNEPSFLAVGGSCDAYTTTGGSSSTTSSDDGGAGDDNSSSTTIAPSLQKFGVLFALPVLTNLF